MFKKKFIFFIIFLGILFAGCVKNYKIYRNLHTPKGMYDKGIDHYVKGDYQDAIKTFKDLKAKFPNAEKYRAWADYEIGFCYFHLGELDKSLKAFRVVLDEHSVRAPRILAARMIIKIKKGDVQKRSSYVD